MDSEDFRRTLTRMAHEILEDHHGAEDLVVVGVLRRGWPVAKRLAFLMSQIEGNPIPCGRLDARAFRDDHRTSSTPDETEIPFEINRKRVLLVDEVIFTGRTTRAALDALITHGRPDLVQLAVLVDRGHRELPIQPNYVGRRLHTERGDHILVRVNEIDGEDSVLLEKSRA